MIHQNYSLYTLIGLAASLSLTLMAFEAHWPEKRVQVCTLNYQYDMYEENQLLPPIPEEPAPEYLYNPLESNPKSSVKLEKEAIKERLMEDVKELAQNMEKGIKQFPAIMNNIIEHNAQPKGGMQAFYKHFSHNLVYPKAALAHKIEGKVFVSFIVNADSTLSNFQLLRGIGYGCDEEAVRVLKLSPKWEPYLWRGVPTKQKFTFPIRFQLKHAKNKEHTSSLKPSTSHLAIIEKALYQDSTDSVKRTEVFNVQELLPEPVGGFKVFYKYLKEHLKYPEMARANGIEGKVFLSFVVEQDGSLTTIKLIRGIGYGCDEEAMRLLLDAPKWQPLQVNRGQVSRKKLTMPITFKLPTTINE